MLVMWALSKEVLLEGYGHEDAQSHSISMFGVGLVWDSDGRSEQSVLDLRSHPAAGLDGYPGESDFQSGGLL